MTNREKLINYAIKANGQYRKIREFISQDISVKDYGYKGKCLTILDQNYPKRFLDLENPPLVIFYKGDIDLLSLPSISVVGSRDVCDYSLKCTKLLVENSNNVIISGLAKGIDSQSHKYAKKTIAILGCGIDTIYPKCNKDLYKKIEKQGLIMSEYPYCTPPLKHHFPFRNRLIVALSEKLYVMKVSEQSGTMTSVNIALELGKIVKVLPFSLLDTSGQTNNKLISEGAQILTFE